MQELLIDTKYIFQYLESLKMLKVLILTKFLSKSKGDQMNPHSWFFVWWRCHFGSDDS